jgi:hypothetical protein
MDLNRPDADRKTAGNISIRIALGNKLENFPLPGRQTICSFAGRLGRFV